MACPICDKPYNDRIDEQRCYNICEVCGYGVCMICMSQIQRSCPSCRAAIRETPVFTRVNNPVPAVAEDAMDLDAPVVLLIDVSGSMDGPSGTQPGAPKRIELASHMAKVTLAECKELNVKCAVYTFSDGVNKVLVDEKMLPAESSRILNTIRPSGSTNLGLALKAVFSNHGETSKYFVFTDGEPTDAMEEAVEKFANTQLHLLAFGNCVKTKLLRAVATSQKHTISYIEDVRSLVGYMVPIFIWAMTDMKSVVLDETDEKIRKRFIEFLGPQVEGSTDGYMLADIVSMLHEFHPRTSTTYSRDLETDTAGTPAHSRIEYSFKADNWSTFGKFYLLCILHCHKYRIPGNAFDPSLKHYQTKEYTEIYDQIAGIPINVEFVSFMTQGSQQAAASAASAAVVQQSIQYFETYPFYSNSSGSEGCIGPHEQITVHRDGQWVRISMEDVVPGDILERSKIKWIIRISDLNHGNKIFLYNGLTPSHPVYSREEGWIKAKYYKDANITYTPDIVYDVILEDPTVGSMKVNDIDVAVVGYPVPGMVHPYWGSSKVVEDVRSRYPDGGFVDVDAKQFGFTNGLVSSLFVVNK